MLVQVGSSQKVEHINIESKRSQKSATPDECGSSNKIYLLCFLW
jgi:hypothetical protein